MISLTALLIVLAAVIGSTAMTAIFAYLLHRIRQIEGTSYGAPGSRQLSDQLDSIRDELLSVREEMSALTERVDFTEKLLTSGAETTPPDESSQ